MPGELPPAHDELPLAGEVPAAAGEQPPRGVVELKLPEFENNCVAYVPESYRNDLPHGLIVWLHAPGGFEQDKLVDLWKPLCDAHGFILLAPQSADKPAGNRPRFALCAKMVDDVRRRYTIDPARLVAHGHQGGGRWPMCWRSSEPGRGAGGGGGRRSPAPRRRTRPRPSRPGARRSTPRWPPRASSPRRSRPASSDCARPVIRSRSKMSANRAGISLLRN